MMLHCRFKLLVSFLTQISFGDECITTNNETAKCVPLHSCLILRRTLESSRSVPEFFRESSCNTNGTDRMVCCGSSSQYAKSEEQQSSFPKLSRTRRFCGLQHSDDYFHTTNGTFINEFPWLVNFGYKDKNGVSLPFHENRCGGSLISHRYVLTSGLCVTVELVTVVSVRFGEYNLHNDTDCTEDMDTYECSDPTVEVEIEKIIVHPGYEHINNLNDIALVKLRKTIHFSDYIRPICLPLPNLPVAKVGDTVVTSGWGHTSKMVDISVKAKIYNRIISGDECERFYQKNKTNFTINESRFCTLHLKNNTKVICNGDAGGPVMFRRRHHWHQEGIVSTGVKECSFQIPVVHTNVAYFLQWIEDNIEE